ERLLTTLQERYRRLDLPLPRRGERLALLPQGAAGWGTPDAQAGWAMGNGRPAFAGLPRGATPPAIIARHPTPVARHSARAGGGAGADGRPRPAHRRPRRGRRRGAPGGLARA